MTLNKKSFPLQPAPITSATDHSDLYLSYRLLYRGTYTCLAVLLVALWCVGLAALFSTAVQANDAVDATELENIESLELVYDQSGVDSHLARVLATVIDESSVAWADCSSTTTSTKTRKELESLLSATSLRTAFLDQMGSRITNDQLAQIKTFMESDVGQRIHKAEVDSNNLSDESFATALAELKQDEKLNEKRANVIKQMITDTGAVYFLSALNTELSTLVIMASVCSNSERDMNQAVFEIKEERGSEALYRSLMRNELLLPAIVVYRELSNSEIEQVSTFAKSDAGNAYYASLIQSLRTVLNVKVGELNMAIKDLPPEH